MNVLRANSRGLFGECALDGVTVVKVESGGSEEHVLEAFDKCKPRAFFVLAYPSKNSLAAALEALGVLPKGGLFFVKDEDEEKRALGIARRMDKFISSKVALLGGTASWLVSPSYGKEDFLKFLGAHVVEINKEAIIDEFEKVKDEEVIDVVRSIKVGASRVLVSDEELFRAAKLHVALGRVFKGFKAGAINCFPLIKDLYVTPCLSLALFNAANFPVACEGDLNSLLGMIITYVAFGKVGGMFNLDYVEDNKVALAHCTAPLTLLDQYSLVKHYETGKPLAIEGHVEPGKASTVLRLYPGGFEALSGTTVEGPRLDACRTQIWVELEHPPDAPGNHRVWIDADDKNVLIQVIRALGLHKA